jgi:hypothetical protein
MHAGFWWGNRKETDPMEDLYMDRGIILKWILKTLAGKAWINIRQDTEKWWAVGSTVNTI